MVCKQYRALRVGRLPICKLCRHMGWDEDRWFKSPRRYLVGGKHDIIASPQ